MANFTFSNSRKDKLTLPCLEYLNLIGLALYFGHQQELPPMSTTVPQAEAVSLQQALRKAQTAIGGGESPSLIQMITNFQQGYLKMNPEKHGNFSLDKAVQQCYLFQLHFKVNSGEKHLTRFLAFLEKTNQTSEGYTFV